MFVMFAVLIALTIIWTRLHGTLLFLMVQSPQGEIERMIDNSFKLVVSKMTKKDQQSINISFI